jgi:thiamine kinase-like enzyme
MIVRRIDLHPTSPEAIVDLQSCLPKDLQGHSTTITPITRGMSGAGVYRVEAGEQAFALKISGAGEHIEGWRARIQIQRLAADAGLAPRIVHVDEERRAVVSEFVADRSFPALYGDPRTRNAAIALLGQTLARVHALPIPPGSEPANPRQLLVDHWSELGPGFAVPAFVADAVKQRRAEEPPAPERPAVLSHNDVNPSNLVYDGEALRLVDWEHAWVNDPYYDLAAISAFLRMDEATCLKLLTAYDGEPVSTLPARFVYDRRVVSVMCGVVFMQLAREAGYSDANAAETLESAPTLGDVYQRMRGGSISLATGEGRWAFGLALVRESFAI